MRKLINQKELIIGILVIFSYFIIGNIISIPLLFLYKKNILSLNIATLLQYFLLTIIFSLIYLKDLKKDYKSFKLKYKSILKISLNYWFKGIFIMLTSSFIIAMFHISGNTNQEANIEMLKQMPIVEIICAVILAPITEELIFRRGLKNFTSNKHIYALTTGLIFAFVHVTSSLSDIKSLIMLVYLIPYSALGIAFGYAYKKTDNIYGTILIHGMHNAISLLEVIILGGLI